MYNRTVDYLKQPHTKANWKGIKTALINELNDPWATIAPYQVRSLAVKDACQAVKKCKRDTKTTGEQHEASFRCKHAPKQSFYLPKNAIDSTGFFKRTLGPMKYAEAVPEIEHDCRVVYEHGLWYVAIPVSITVQVPKTKELIVALDPGVRTFQTMYSPRVAGTIGDGAWERILKLCYAMDRIKSKLSAKTCRAKQRRNLRSAYRRHSRNLKRLKDELHWKAAVFLDKSFHLIIIPEFSAKDMSRRNKRKIRNKTVRSMLTLSHYLFRERLKQAAEKYGSRVFVVSEAYTSRTCTRCGHDHEHLAGAKTFVCPSCGLRVSRDINGARNILLRAMPDLAAVFNSLSINEC